MRTFILAMFAVITVNVFAQEKPLITEAILALRKNDMVEAKKNIDEASTIIDQKGEGAIDPKQMSKFLYNKGLIYQRIAASTNEDLRKSTPDAIDIAAESYLQLFDYEERMAKKRYSDDAIQPVMNLSSAINSRAFDKYGAQDFSGAAEDFMKAYNMKKNPGLGQYAKYDSTSYYYAAVNYSMAQDYENAVKIMKELLDMKYAGHSYTADVIAADGSVAPQAFPNRQMMEQWIEMGKAQNPVIGPSMRPEIYSRLLQIYQTTEDMDNFNTTLQLAREEYPNEINFINIELQKYLDAEEYDKALNILEAAITSNPDNALYYYVKGFIYQTNVKDNEKALEAYATATEKDPENFDSWFMSGVVWYDQGKATLDEMNQLGMSSAEQKKYEQLKGVKNDFFKKSIPYFEKAYVINSEDLETVKALWEVYRQLGDYEKVKEMKAKMDALSGGAETQSEME